MGCVKLMPDMILTTDAHMTSLVPGQTTLMLYMDKLPIGGAMDIAMMHARLMHDAAHGGTLCGVKQTDNVRLVCGCSS